jgi:photosystem II stability/assembly factor-like uncharacterized protein
VFPIFEYTRQTMKKLYSLLLSSLFLLCATNPIQAQEFLKPANNQTPSFRQLQRNFNEWKQQQDLRTKKGWKSFKRWEQETQMHTNGHGETDGVEEYLNALLNAADEKTDLRTGKTTANPWYPVGPYNLPTNLTGYMENGMGRVNTVAFHPTNAGTFYVGVAQGGLWKTTNNGLTYTPLTDNLPITRISDIAIDPTNPDIIYIALCDFEYVGTSLFTNGRKRNTHYGLGVYKTTDGGLTWAPTGLSYQLTNGDVSLIRKIIIDPNNNNNVVACGVDGFFKSNDGGNTFTSTLDSLCWDLHQDPVNPNTLYLATGWIQVANIGSAGVYKSTDFGTTWTLLTTGIPVTGTVQRVKLAQSQSDPTILYALAVDTQGGLHAIYKTTNAGNTWNLQFNTLNLLTYDEGFGTGGQGNYDLGFLVHPTDPDKVYVGGVNLWASEDGANTFDPAGHWTTSYGPSIHADVHDLKVNPLNGNFYICHDGGIYRTQNIVPETWANLNSGSTFQTIWANLSNGMNITSFYRISSSKTTTNEIVAGAQDNASFYYDGTSWSTVSGGDGMDNVFDTAFTGTFFTSSQYGNFDYTFDGGQSFNWINPNINGENAEWTSPIISDNNNYLTLYAGFENVVKSIDAGNTWSSISNFPLPPNFYGNELSAIAVSPVNSNVLWAARRVRYEYSNPGEVFRTNNGGSTWTTITSNLPDSLYYTSIEADQFSGQTAYISCAGFSSGQKVYKTSNAGTNWTNISYNLPNLPVNCIKQLPGKTDLIAATDIGVYVLPAGSTSWVNFSAGLPNVIVSDIEFNPANNKVYISTFGRGIWATDLDVLTGISTNEPGKVLSRLYPSLNKGSFTLELIENKTGASIEILDIHGRQLKQIQSREQQLQINETLSAGMYYTKIRVGQRLEVIPFIVE